MAELVLRLRVTGGQDVSAALKQLNIHAQEAGAKLVPINTQQMRMGATGQTAARAMSNLSAMMAGTAAIASILARNNPELQQQLQALSIAGSALSATLRTVGAAFRLAMLNPIGLTIAAIAALVAVTVLLIKNWESVREAAVKIWGSLKDFFVRLGEGLKDVFTGLFTIVRGFFTRDLALMNQGRAQLGEGLAELKDVAVDLGQSVKAFAVTAFGQLKNLLVSTKEDAGKLAEQLAELQHEMLMNEITQVTIPRMRELAAATHNMITEARDQPRVARELQEAIDQNLADLREQNVETQQSAQTLGGAWQDSFQRMAMVVETGPTDALRVLKTTALDTGDSIGAAMGAAMRQTLQITAQGTDIFTQLWVAALNKVIEKLIQAIALQQALNAIGNFLGGLFGGLLGLIGIRLQHGGIVTRPTLAMVGEAGPEAVIPLNRAPQMAPALAGGGGNMYIFQYHGDLPDDPMRIKRVAAVLMEEIRLQSGRR